MFDKKEYHRKYMRKYRENVIKKSPEKMKRIHETRRKLWKVWIKNPEWLEKNRMLHRMYSKKHRLKPGIREKQTEQHKKYVNTIKGKKSIRKSIDKYCLANPERVKAWSAVHYANSKGRMKKLPCKVCGNKNVHAHHPDPKRQLEVIYLCPLHHRREHLKQTA